MTESQPVEVLIVEDDPHDLERQVPRLRLVEDVAFLTMPTLVSRLGTYPGSRALYAVLRRVPFYRNLVRHLRYAFPVQR